MHRLAVTFAISLALWALGCGGGDDRDPGDAAVNTPDSRAPDDARVADATPIDAPDVPDADPDAPDAGNDEPDAATPDAAVGVPCGDMLCDATQECCVTGTLGNTTYECVEPGTCDGTPAACDGPEDCTDPGELCCGSLQDGYQCTPEADCQAVVCHDDGDCPELGQTCCNYAGALLCATVCPGG